VLPLLRAAAALTSEMQSPLWNDLGFNDDVFFVRPLAATAHDVRMFVGRESETALFLAGLARSTRGLLVVGGDTGVGKTSFVNMQQHMSYAGLKPTGLRPA
jgi:ATP-dependent Clp protease ATP-binding subunit ClpA